MNFMRFCALSKLFSVFGFRVEGAGQDGIEDGIEVQPVVILGRFRRVADKSIYIDLTLCRTGAVAESACTGPSGAVGPPHHPLLLVGAFVRWVTIVWRRW
jgi:hypothetical protein